MRPYVKLLWPLVSFLSLAYFWSYAMVPFRGFLLDVLWQTGSLSFAQSTALKQRMEPFKGRRSSWSLTSCNDYTQELWLRGRLKVRECKLQGMERAKWIDWELVSPLQSWVRPQYYSQDVAFDLGLRPFSRWTLIFPISVTTSLRLCLAVFVGFCFLSALQCSRLEFSVGGHPSCVADCCYICQTLDF